MASWSTLIVAGRIDENLPKEKLSSLLSNCLITCYGTGASQVDADYAQFVTAFAKPTLSNEFGLTNAHSGDGSPSAAHHLIRIQYNPTSEQFRSALREGLRHALNGARPADTQAPSSTDGRVSIVYVGQVLGPTGEWLLADSHMSGQVLTSWLDSDAARQSWWPQLDKFPNQGDRLHLQVITPLAGTGTSWSPTKPGHPNRLMTHVDTSMVQLDLAVEGSWRLNGRPVVMDTLGAAYDGLRTFAQLAIEHHSISQFELTTNGPPLGCTLAAERPALYVFPGGGVASQASGLFSLQGFTMLLNGSFTGNGAPGWWSMVRNLSKLDTIVLPDWSAANVLTHQFVSQSHRSQSSESRVLGDVLAPPPCALAPGEVTGGLVIHAPSTADQPHCLHWAPSTTGDTSPPAVTLYFKLGWGELKLQPLAQRAGLVLIWTSALPAGGGAARVPASLRIVYPATQLPGTTSPAQGLARLLKALGSVVVVEHSANGAVDSTSTQKSNTTAHNRPGATKHTSSVPSAKPSTESSNRPLTNPPTRAATANHAPARPSTTESQSSMKKPSVPKRPATATNRPTTTTAKPQSSSETKPQSAKPQSTSRPIPSRPATASKTSAARTPSATNKSSQPNRSETAASSAAAGTTTASRLAAHANLVAAKQTGSKSKAPPPTTTTAHPTSKPVAKPPGPARTTSDKVSKPNQASAPAPPVAQPEPTTRLNESLELAPMDPLITGWLPSEQPSPVVTGEATSLQTPAAAPATEESHQGPDYSELYRVHKYEHLNEADEMALGDEDRTHTIVDMPLTTGDSRPDASAPVETKPVEDQEHRTETAAATQPHSPHPPQEPEDLPHPLTNSSVSEVLKLIDPTHDQHALGSPELPEPQLFSMEREELDSEMMDSAQLMSRPPPFLEANVDQEPVVESSELRASHLADTMVEGPPLSSLHDTGDDLAFAAASGPSDSKEAEVHAGLELHDQDADAHAGDHQAVLGESEAHHELFDQIKLENVTPAQPTTDLADIAADIPADLAPRPIESEMLEQPVEEPAAEPLHSLELQSRPPLDIGFEDDSLPDAVNQISVSGELSHSPKLALSALDHEDHQEQTNVSSPAWNPMQDEAEPVDSALGGSTPAAETESIAQQEMRHPDVDDSLPPESHDHALHVEVDQSKEPHDAATTVHPTAPYEMQAQLGSPGSDTSELEMNDREFWVSATRAPHTMAQPLDGELSSPADVVLDSHELIASQAHQDWSAPDAVPGTTEEEEVKPSAADQHLHPDLEVGAVGSGSPVQPTDVVRLSADSLETTREEEEEEEEAHQAQPPMDFVPFDGGDHQSQAVADSTTTEDHDALIHSRPIGFVGFTPDQTATDLVNLGSPASEASVDSVVHATGPAGFISASNQIESGMDDGRNWPIGFKHLDAGAVHTNGQNGLPLDDEAPTNGVHHENGNHHGVESPPDYVKKAMSFIPSELGLAPEVHSAGDGPIYPPSLHESDIDLPPMASAPQESADSKVNEAAFDPLSAWGQPQGMPAPAPPTAKPDAKHKAPMSSSSNRPGGAAAQRPGSALKSSSVATKSAPAAAPVVLPPGPPIYLDLIWVPSYLAYVPQSLAVEFFARVRARVYVISGEALHPTVGEALLAGKAKWNPNDVDLLCRSTSDAHLSILPTDEPYEWAYWLRTPVGREDHETGESRLQASGFRVMPTASLCDIEYSANNVAFRCEGVRVDL